MYTCNTYKTYVYYLFQKMKPVILLLFLVAAPHATRTALVPPARSVHHHHHVSALPPYHLELLPAPRYTSTPYPLQQSTPTPAQPSTAPPARPLSIACDPDEAPSPPTFVTRYPTPHTFRSKTNPPANHCHMLPPPQYKNMYFHIPMHINPMIHTPQTKKKTRTRSTPSRRTHVLQLSPSNSHRIFMAILILLNPPHTSDTPKRANALAHILNGNAPVTRTMSQSPKHTPNTNPEPQPPENYSSPLKVPRTHCFDGP